MLSFIVPVYNSERDLNKCISSILSISLEKEIVLVDDGSTDSSGVICSSFATGNSCIQYIRKENGGAASARNMGMEHSSGDYVVFVDSDDFLDAKWSEEIEKALKKDADLYVYGMAFDYYDDNNQIIRSDILSNRYSGIRKKTEIEKTFAEYFQNNTLSSACNKIFKSQIIKDNHLRYNEKMTLYEDMDFVLKYLSHISSVLFIPEPLYHYRLLINNSHSVCRTSNLLKARDNLDQLARTVNCFSDEDSVHSVMSNLYIDILMSGLLNDDNIVKTRQESLAEYIHNENISEKELSAVNREAYEMIKNGEYRKLHTMVKWKKTKSSLKRRIKKFIGR